MKNILGALAGLAALAFASSAGAVPISIDTSGTIGSGIATIGASDIAGPAPGVNFTGEGSISIVTGTTFVSFAADVAGFSTTAPRIENLILSLFSDIMRSNLIGTFTITTGTGAANGPLIDGRVVQTFDLSGLSTLYFSVSGTAFEISTVASGRPDFNVQLAAVPVPAALPLLLSGLAGLGFATRRRKTA